ncbi:MAG: alpha/beta hydrolase [Rhodanobacteraceae bacterium]|jgi:pimeloyl-ACP methyl ester carboxylesterase|nr:alpha/beta hydrolase [Rhodanobacteraceae bacterium]
MHPRLLLLLSLLLAATPAGAAAPSVIPVDRVADAYVQPHQRVEVEPGRKMNIHCAGTGSPTVIFESGLSDWSNTWALIQPAVATRTRACSYDRPGMGYSDPSRHHPTPENAVLDLHTLLDRAGIEGPLVVVGHSLGGFYMKLYAATYPGQVAGIVLVDPSEERLWKRVGPALASRFGAKLVREAADDDDASIKQGIAHFQECADKARKASLDDATYLQCSDPVRTQLGATINAERRKLQVLAPYQTAQADEFAYSMFAPDRAADARYARLFGGRHPFGNKPLVVLTHSIWDMTPPFGETGWLSWVTAHRQTAAMSARGTARVVPMTRHNIQVDQPQAVIDAVVGVLDSLAAP